MAEVDRPYSGTWAPNRQPRVQWTPDALVYLNGDTALPGCRTCRHSIDIQRFVTSISTDTSVEAGASSATLSLSIPRSYGDSIFRDGKSLLTVGLEVNIYFRGYFPMTGLSPEDERVGGVRLADVPQHPYYPAFHGVVTGVSEDYSGGYYSVSLTCAGMLHFWQYMKLADSGSFFGARPTNSRVRTTLTGHPFSGMTPHAIIYNLYRDTAGAAAGVGFALQSRTNFGAVSATTGDSMYALTTRYWERRFRDRMYGLRMHGAGGQLFTSSQQAFVSRYRSSSSAGRVVSANVSPRTARPSRDPYSGDTAVLLGLADRSPDGRVLRQPDLSVLPSAGGGSAGLNLTQMQPYVTDISSYGQVNLFESTYESKLDIAGQVTLVTGFEFFQDVDGDLVFKPPLYNLDTSSSRVYRLEPEDIETFSPASAEPEATYVIVKAGAFSNLHGVVDQAEFGVRSVYVNYPLVAQFGWREHSVETAYFNSARSAFFAGVAQLDRMNAGVHSASATIAFRPEIRPGYPVYIPSIDCYYYVTSVSHSFQFGGHCSTTLQLTARRSKFYAPGSANVRGVEGIRLDATHLPSRPLTALSNDGVPKLVGFPNVVMALDPTAINPMFYVYGFGAEETALNSGNAETRARNREIFVTGFVRSMWERGLFAVRGGSSDTPIDPFSGDPNIEFYVPRDGFSDIPFTFASIREAVSNYLSLRDTSRAAIGRTERALAAADAAGNAAEVERLSTILRVLRSTFEPPTADPNFQSAADRFRSFTEVLATVPAGRRGSTPSEVLRPPSGSEFSADQNALILFSYLIGQIRPLRPGANANDATYDPTGVVNETANILELLSDRKAAFGVNTPGAYRYYSSSHPLPEQQGYEEIDRTENVSASSDSGSSSPPGGDPNLPPSRRYPPTPTTLSGRVAYQPTELTPTQALSYLREAWITLRGTPPTDAVLSVLAAQWALESGRGQHMYNFNFGGVKTGRAWAGGRVLLGTTEGLERTPTERYFRAYGNFSEGAYDYIRNLLVNHAESIASVETTGNPDAFTDHLASYHTGPAASYIRNIRGLSREARAEWIPAANGGAGEQPSFEDGSSSSRGSSLNVPIPPESLECAVVRTADQAEGLSDEATAPLVSIGRGTPTNGLRVRVAYNSEPRVVPTSQIFTLTFDQRSVPRVTNRPTVVLRDGTTPAEAIAFFRSVLAGNPRLVDSLASSLIAALPAGGLTTVRPATQLVAAAVNGISGIRNGSGAPLTTTNYASGTPNSVADPDGSITGADLARRVLRSKARALLVELSAAHRAALEFAISTLSTLPPAAANGPVPEAVTSRLRPWRESLSALFRGRGVPRSVPFTTVRGSHYVSERMPTWSPVFPISDERGYDHYGALQYGRGLSIEPGGNYEALMSTDPFQYADPALVDRFVRSLSHGNLRDASGNFELPASARAVLRDIARSEEFASSAGGRTALRLVENDSSNGDRTTQIANGLANYVMSNRDAVGKLSPNNVARRLADLRPAREQEYCDCRGAEADLLLAAYAAGASETTFVSVEGAEDTATTWARGRAAAAADSWARVQSALRGLSTTPNPVENIRALVDEIGTAGSAATAEISEAVSTGTARLGSIRFP